jgi:predicted nucleotidyltransferase
MHPTVEARLPEIRALCRKYGVRRLELFGSAARDDFDPASSDVDLLVEWDASGPASSLPGRWWGLERELEELLERPVDLMTLRSIRNAQLRAVIERQPRHVLGP